MIHLSTIKIVIADADKDYLDSLADYLISCHSESFKITAFSSADSLKEYLLGPGQNQDIILAGPGFYEMIKDQLEGPVVLLSPLRALDGEYQEKRIFKYQTGEMIVNALLQFMSKERSGDKAAASGRKTKIIAVYSPLGGSGKTTVALGASILSSWGGMKVFYLNLESISSTRFILAGNNEQGLSHVLYYVKESKDNLLQKLERAKCIDPLYKIHYYLPTVSILDLTEDMAEEIRTLLVCLKGSGQYDSIFIDLDSCLNSNNLSVLEEADEILIVAVQSPLSGERLEFMEKQLQLLERGRSRSVSGKVKLILNKDIQGLNKSLAGLSINEKYIYHRIPFVKDLYITREDGIWRLDMNSPFADSVHELIKSLKGGGCR